MDEGFKVYIDKNFLDYSVNIHLVERRNGKTYYGVCSDLVFTEIKDFEAVKGPTIRLPLPYSEAIMKAFAEAFDKNNIKTENDFKIQGLLEATKYHLQDLRSLLKLK